MGKRDEVLAVYLEDKNRYADLVDGLLFDGKTVVKPEDIQEKDTRTSGVTRSGRGRRVVQKYRDIIRRVTVGVTVVIIALEHQDQVHQAMPIRVMMSDAAGYDEQMRKIQRKHREKRDLKGAEFLGGFSERDSIDPIVTMVLYYGEEPWNAPRDLYDMMDFEKIPEELKKYVNHYPIHVIELKRLQNLDVFHTDLREVIGFVQCAKDKEATRKFVEQHRARFEHLESDAYDVIAALTHSEELKNFKQQCQEGKGINMCQAIKEMIEDGRVEGRVEGLAEGRAEGLAEGRAEGLTEGRTEGRTCINALNRFLLLEGRHDDLIRAIQDSEYQEKLLKEYQL